MEYNWNKNMILNDNIPNDVKKELLGELKNELVESDPSILTLPTNTFIFKLIFEKQIKELNKIYPRFIHNAYNINKFITPELVQAKIDYPEINITPEELVNTFYDFIKSINDKDLIKAFDKIKDKNNHMLRIVYNDNTTQITNYVNGRVLKVNSSVYGSYYINGNAYDYSIFAHEIGHMLSGILFKNNYNALFLNYLKEFESYFFENIFASYLDNNKDDLHLSTRLNRLSKISENGFNILFQRIISDYPITGYKKIEKMFNNKLDNNIKESITFRSFYHFSLLINSYIYALNLTHLAEKDLEKSIYIYKHIISDDNNNIDELTKKYNLCNNLSIVKKEDEKIRKILYNNLKK